MYVCQKINFYVSYRLRNDCTQQTPYGHNIRYLFNFKQYLNLELKVALKCLSSISMLLTQQTEFRAYT